MSARSDRSDGGRGEREGGRGGEVRYSGRTRKDRGERGRAAAKEEDGKGIRNAAKNASLPEAWSYY